MKRQGAGKRLLGLILGSALSVAGLAGEGSGDGKKVAAGEIIFSSKRTGSWRLWTMNPDGKEMRQFLKGEKTGEFDVDPCFSSDGTLILFTSTRGGKVGLWKVGVDGSGLKRVCDGDQGEWSPDGRKIAFRRNSKIFVLDVASGKAKQVVPDDFKTCSGPSWSPDGKIITFACRWDAGNGIFKVAAEGGKPEKIYDKKGACEPHWSPDGKLLTYETSTHVCTIQPDGKKNQLATYWAGVQRYPRWSPDGKTLIFCQGVTEKGPWQLYKIAVGGEDPVKLTEGGNDMNPDWRKKR
jgi:Tol biopolymer transport system component